MSNSAWIDDFFVSGFYQKTYMDRFTEEQTEAEVAAVVKLLGAQLGSRILDWCGGWGRHAIPLAKRGYEVVLLDYTPLHIQMAREAAARNGLTLRFVEADFRQTPPDIQADYAINMFTAGIGYLGKNQDLVALKSLGAALKSGATILLDTMSLYWIVRNYNPRGWQESKDERTRLLEERCFNFLEGTNSARMIFLEAGQPERASSNEIKCYTPHELAEVVAEAGFGNIRVFGNLNGVPFDFESKRIVMLANKF